MYSSHQKWLKKGKLNGERRWVKGAAVRCEAGQCSWWGAICECAYSYCPVLIMTTRANIHLSLCLAECVSTVRVAPPAAGGSSVEWWAMTRYWALGPGCVSSVGCISPTVNRTIRPLVLHSDLDFNSAHRAGSEILLILLVFKVEVCYKCVLYSFIDQMQNDTQDLQRIHRLVIKFQWLNSYSHKYRAISFF